jgi:FtsH-binding integral membrane protein
MESTAAALPVVAPQSFLQLYLDFINLFLYMLRLFGQARR